MTGRLSSFPVMRSKSATIDDQRGLAVDFEEAFDFVLRDQTINLKSGQYVNREDFRRAVINRMYETLRFRYPQNTSFMALIKDRNFDNQLEGFNRLSHCWKFLWISTKFKTTVKMYAFEPEDAAKADRKLQVVDTRNWSVKLVVINGEEGVGGHHPFVRAPADWFVDNKTERFSV